eukprot:4745899-Prymnesium_polylepis.1
MARLCVACDAYSRLDAVGEPVAGVPAGCARAAHDATGGVAQLASRGLGDSGAQLVGAAPGYEVLARLAGGAAGTLCAASSST